MPAAEPTEVLLTLANAFYDQPIVGDLTSRRVDSSVSRHFVSASSRVDLACRQGRSPDLDPSQDLIPGRTPDPSPSPDPVKVAMKEFGFRSKSGSEYGSRSGSRSRPRISSRPRSESRSGPKPGSSQRRG